MGIHFNNLLNFADFKAANDAQAQDDGVKNPQQAELSGANANSDSVTLEAITQRYGDAFKAFDSCILKRLQACIRRSRANRYFAEHPRCIERIIESAMPLLAIEQQPGESLEAQIRSVRMGEGEDLLGVEKACGREIRIDLMNAGYEQEHQLAAVQSLIDHGFHDPGRLASAGGGRFLRAAG